MGQTSVQYIDGITVQTNLLPYPRYIGEVLSHPYIQNTLLEVLEVWDGQSEVWGNLNEPIPFPYGSESNPITRDWNTPPPRKDESSKYPIYKCRVNGSREEWVIFRWILLDESKPTDLLGYSNIQVASGNQLLPIPVVPPNLPITTVFRVSPLEVSFSFSTATFSTVLPPVNWTPANITTQLWLDASDGDTITTVSSAVSQWNDKSGNNRNAIQATPANRPIIASSILNGLNALSFDGVNDSLITPNIFNSASDVSVFIVHNALSTNSTGRGAISLWSTTDSRNGYFHALARNNITNGFRSTFTQDEQTAGNISINAPAPFAINNWNATSHGRRSTNQFLSYNGTNQEVSTTGQCNFVDAKAVIGYYFSATPIFYGWHGYIAEIVIISSYATTDIRQRMEGYLAHKWGLTANLPIDHPYKTNPPTV